MATTTAPRTAKPATLTQRIAALDWQRIGAELDESGVAVLRSLLTARECDGLARLYPFDELFRSRVTMARHGFGCGEYKYFAYPLPDVVAQLRRQLYAGLAPIANRWSELLGDDVRYPAEHDAYVEVCHRAGQHRPTPLLLEYGPGDYNRLHRDVYGEHVFPLQAVLLLSVPHEDFSGGELVLTEQRPRMQSRVEVVPLAQGDAAVFAVQHRPVRGARGHHRAAMRHGVSAVRSGRRYTAGVIFHDAR